jgi:hypothetical protein
MNQKRTTYTAIIGTIAHNGDVCLENLREDGKILRDHCWLRRDRAGEELDTIRDLNVYNKIEFTAVPYEYTKRDPRTRKEYNQLGVGDLKGVNRL